MKTFSSVISVFKQKKTRKPTKVSERLVSKARDLFCRNGIAETGVQEVIKEAKVSRMALYNRFGSKQALVVAALRLEGEDWRKWFFEAIEKSGNTAEERLRNIFIVLEEWFGDRDYYGCFFINAIAGGGKSDSDYRELAVEHKSLIKGYLRQIAWEAGCRDPEGFVEKLLVIVDGVIVCRLVNRHLSLQSHSEDLLDLLLKDQITDPSEQRSAA